MSESCCNGSGCGCGCGVNSASYYTDRNCPGCGGKLRLSGNPYTIRYHLLCPSCGHTSSELTQEEFRELMD